MTRTDDGRLIVISGPSGAGKSTVISRVMASRADLAFSVSATTRRPRGGETDGKDYFFISREKFAEMAENGEFLEHAEYVGNRYGTPRRAVEENLGRGITVILDIEVQGAANVRRAMPEAVLVFLAPPSFAELESRLRGRKQDSEEKILGRLEQARVECAKASEYDYIIINDDADSAVRELDSIITAEKCRAAGRIKYIS